LKGTTTWVYGLTLSPPKQIMRRITSDFVYPINKPAVKKGVVVCEDDGTIITVMDPYIHEIPEDTEYHPGIIIPGLINSHCHLELSWIKGNVPEHTGLDQFIRLLEQIRKELPSDQIASMREAETEMIRNGIVAVGDISNGSSSFSVKSQNHLHYHTFIELFAFDPARAWPAIENGIRLTDEFYLSMPQKNISVTPHAPYSVSEKLLNLIFKIAVTNGSPVTIHNQESLDEFEFFTSKKGAIVDRLSHFGVDLSSWNPPGKSSVQSILPMIPQGLNIQFVHNTFTELKDLTESHKVVPNAYWCICPGANLFIENKLPDINLFVRKGVNITLGTDSLASNHQLCILTEMKIIQQSFPEIPLDDILTWATLNGARFLGIDSTFGSIEAGKKPGLNLIKGTHNEKNRELFGSSITPLL
jgi:aminodeoxyfutalosine deaminase